MVAGDVVEVLPEQRQRVDPAREEGHGATADPRCRGVEALRRLDLEGRDLGMPRDEPRDDRLESSGEGRARATLDPQPSLAMRQRGPEAGEEEGVGARLEVAREDLRGFVVDRPGRARSGLEREIGLDPTQPSRSSVRRLSIRMRRHSRSARCAWGGAGAPGMSWLSIARFELADHVLQRLA